jgi:Ca2+-binding EF-hand superfamily protein
MTTRSRITLTSLVAATLASIALAAGAQTQKAEPTAKDKAAMEAAFAKADTNADGKLSKEEAAMYPAIAAKFDELDKNKDGFLSLAEFAAGFMAA